MIAKLNREIAEAKLKIAFLKEKSDRCWLDITTKSCASKIYDIELAILDKERRIHNYAKAFKEFTDVLSKIPNVFAATAGYDDSCVLWVNTPANGTQYYTELPGLWDLEFTGYDFMGYLTTYGTIDLQPALEDIAGAVWIKKETTKKKGSK